MPFLSHHHSAAMRKVCLGHITLGLLCAFSLFWPIQSAQPQTLPSYNLTTGPVESRQDARKPGDAQQNPAQSRSTGQQASDKQDAKANKEGKQGESKQDNKGGKQGKEEAGKGKSDEEKNKPSNHLFGVQATSVLQHLFPFHSPYSGPNSLISRDEYELAQSFTIFAGYKVTRSVEVFLNPEWLLGSGLSTGKGLSGPSNGELHGQGELSNDPYLARAFVRWRIATGRSGQVGQAEVGRSENLIPGTVPARRVVITAGKFAASDVFDPSRYANDPRTEFLADPLSNNPAIDFPQDTRGYSLGLTAAWNNPEFTLRLGSFEMPTQAGGAILSGDLIHSRGDLLEAEVYPHLFRHRFTIIRLLAFRNFAHMGKYEDALAQEMQGMPPDITKVERAGAVKYGYGLNFEQPISDDGSTGFFLRYGWNNGATESFAFEEADRALTLGAQLSGAHWKRSDDRVGLALIDNAISAAHRDYLAAGGQGLQLGDGKLRYADEHWIETYYYYKLADWFALSLHYQFISNPGYNADRGPVHIISLQAHLEFGL